MTPSEALQQYALEVAAWPVGRRLGLRCVDCQRQPACAPWPVAEPAPVCAACWERRETRGKGVTHE